MIYSSRPFYFPACCFYRLFRTTSNTIIFLCLSSYLPCSKVNGAVRPPSLESFYDKHAFNGKPFSFVYESFVILVLLLSTLHIHRTFRTTKVYWRWQRDKEVKQQCDCFHRVWSYGIYQRSERVYQLQACGVCLPVWQHWSGQNATRLLSAAQSAVPTTRWAISASIFL